MGQGVRVGSAAERLLRLGGDVPTPRELAKEREEQAQHERQAEAACEGLEQVKTAFAWLNVLEHRTTGC